MRKLFVVLFILTGCIILLINPKKTTDVILTPEPLLITLPNRVNVVASKMYSSRPRHVQLLDKSYFYFEDGKFYNSVTGLVSDKAKKIIDISSYQGVIDFTKVKEEVDGVILRIGFGYKTQDSKLEEYIKQIKELKIPYGIYLYSYAENKEEAIREAKFTKELIKKYDLKPKLGIYYDIEEFYVKGQKVNFTKDVYQKIIEGYINYLKDYNVSVYTYAKLYKYKLNDETRKYVTWIAQYNYSFNYQDSYKIWQYTSGGTVDGINTKVDMNVMFIDE